MGGSKGRRRLIVVAPTPNPTPKEAQSNLGLAITIIVLCSSPGEYFGGFVAVVTPT